VTLPVGLCGNKGEAFLAITLTLALRRSVIQKEQPQWVGLTVVQAASGMFLECQQNCNECIVAAGGGAHWNHCLQANNSFADSNASLTRDSEIRPHAKALFDPETSTIYCRILVTLQLNFHLTPWKSP
jgi:hypothetical protein